MLNFIVVNYLTMKFHNVVEHLVAERLLVLLVGSLESLRVPCELGAVVRGHVPALFEMLVLINSHFRMFHSRLVLIDYICNCFFALWEVLLLLVSLGYTTWADRADFTL